MGKLQRIILPVAIVAVGGALFFGLRSMRAAPQRVERIDLGPLVQTADIDAAPVRVTVKAQGTVRPDREIDVVPQVSGVIEWISPELEAGGFFVAGDVLARIESEDYELAQAQAQAEVERSIFQLQIERGEADVARLEWERLHPQTEPDPLVVRTPQVQAAAAALRAAQARLRETELRLERTQLLAPFHGRVRSVVVDAGQYVTMGRAIARIYSIETAQIVVPIADEELAWIDVPSSAEVSPHIAVADAELAVAMPSAPVTIKARYAGRQHEWTGRVVRSEGELDPRSRMIRLVIEVSDPYGRLNGPNPSMGADQDMPLMVGLFCDVEIRGRVLEDVYALPRGAIHAGDQVWSATREGELRIHTADVVRTDREQGLVRLTLAPGERVITSQLKGITDGMQVRVMGASTSASGGER
jgi:RND family efflux transporter MFP subunit